METACAKICLYTMVWGAGCTLFWLEEEFEGERGPYLGDELHSVLCEEPLKCFKVGG